jgi:hypothetical protein
MAKDDDRIDSLIIESIMAAAVLFVGAVLVFAKLVRK